MDVEFTSNHRDHDPRWLMRTSTADAGLEDSAVHSSCFACIVELLEDPDFLQVKKKLVLAEMLRLLSYHDNQMEGLLREDERVTAHVALVLLGLMKSSDETFASMAVEVCVEVICQVKSDDVVCCLLDAISQQTLKVCNYKACVAVFSLIGRLLQAIPPLAQQLLKSYGSLVDYLCGGLCYQDESVQTSLCFIVQQLYAAPSRNAIPERHHRQVATAIMEILVTSTKHQLCLNAMGVLKTMLEDTRLVEVYMSTTHTNITLTAALKKMLLAREDMLPVAAVQSVSTILTSTRGRHHAELLLQQDMAEFLFETLPTTNELLLSSIFCCLIMFSDVDTFFVKCHSVYGIESIMRGIDQAFKLKTPEVVAQGMTLLAKILLRHSGGIRLFSNGGLVQKCLSLIADGLIHHNQQIFIQASKAATHILQKDHLLSPAPYKDITDMLTTMVTKVAEHPRMQCRAAGTGKVGSRRGRGDSAAIRALATQQRITAMVAVLAQATRLAQECSSDPMACSGTFSTPQKPTDYGLEKFSQFILHAVDEVCIPTVLANSTYLAESAVFHHMYCMLNLLAKLCSQQMAALANKLISAGFVTATVNIKANTRDDAKKEMEDFLYFLCAYSVTKTKGENKNIPSLWLQAVKQGLHMLNGGEGELLSVLTQNSADPPDLQLAHSQWTAYCLLYVTTTTQDSAVPLDLLLRSVVRYLQVHEASLTSLPMLTIQHLVSLLAISSVKRPPDTYLSKGENSLVALLEGAHIEQWCIISVGILHWCFSHACIADRLGAAVVGSWLNQENCDVNSELVKLARKNRMCLVTLLRLVTSEQRERVAGVAPVLATILDTHKDSKEPVDAEVVQVVRAYLPETLLNLLLKDSTLDCHREALLSLLCIIRRQHPQSELTDTDFKLAYHVSNILTKAETLPSMEIAAINFLNSLLIDSVEQKQSRVSSMLLSNSGLGCKLESLIGRNVAHPASTMLSLLAVQHHLHKLQTDETVKVDFEKVVMALSSRSSEVLLGSLQLFDAYFRCGARGGLLEMCVSGEGLGIGDSGTSLPVTQLRSIFINLQHCILSAHCAVRDWALSGMSSMLVCFRGKHIGDHLASHPWNRMLLETLLRQVEDYRMAPFVINICHLFVKVNIEAVPIGHMIEMIEYFSDCEGDENSTSWLSLASLVKQIVTTKADLQLDLRVQDKVVLKLRSIPAHLLPIPTFYPLKSLPREQCHNT